MDLWLILTIALAPGIFWLWYFYQRDRHEPEPLSLVVRMFLLGIIAAALAFIIESLVVSYLPAIVFIALAVPLIEELLKFLVVALFVYRDHEFDEPMDGIVYATATALGFATLENILYVIDLPTLSALVVTGSLRAILSVPAHALFAVIWGYALGVAKFMPENSRKSTVILGGLFLAITIHAAFNFMLEQQYTGLAVILLLALPLVWWFADKRIRAALINSRLRSD